MQDDNQDDMTVGADSVDLQKNLDILDHSLLLLVAERLLLAGQAGAQPLDPSQQAERIQKIALESGVDPALAQSIMAPLING
jgi:chorismate mutase